jgi:hypothetical protein
MHLDHLFYFRYVRPDTRNVLPQPHRPSCSSGSASVVSSSSISTTSAAGSDDGSLRLWTGAKAGIGVGVALGVLALLDLVLFLLSEDENRRSVIQMCMKQNLTIYDRKKWTERVRGPKSRMFRIQRRRLIPRECMNAGLIGNYAELTLCSSFEVFCA